MTMLSDNESFSKSFTLFLPYFNGMPKTPHTRVFLNYRLVIVLIISSEISGEAKVNATGSTATEDLKS